MAKKHFLKKLKRLSRPKKALLVALFSILVLASIPALLIAFRAIWFVLYLATYKVTHCTNQKLPVQTVQDLSNMIIYKDSGNVCASTLDGQSPTNLIDFLDLHDDKAGIGGGDFIELNTATNKMFFIMNKFRSSKKYGVLLYEKDLGTGEIKKLLAYNPTEFSRDDGKDTLVVSKDGQHVIYESEKGLMHYSLKSKRYRTLAENNVTRCAKTEYGIFEENYSFNCYVYQIRKLDNDGTLEFISTKPQENYPQNIKLVDGQDGSKTWYEDNSELSFKGGVFVGQETTIYWDAPKALGQKQIKFDPPELKDKQPYNFVTSPDGQRLAFQIQKRHENKGKVTHIDNEIWIIYRSTLKPQLMYKKTYEAKRDFFGELYYYDFDLQWDKNSKNVFVIDKPQGGGAGPIFLLDTDSFKIFETKMYGSSFIGLTN